jgi:ribosomal 50S subunit-associated protein YjgA (DUF615 family)
MTERHIPTAALEGTAADEELIRQLVEQVERTFDTEGRARAMASVTDMLRRLDPATLQALAIQREMDA